MSGSPPKKKRKQGSDESQEDENMWAEMRRLHRQTAQPHTDQSQRQVVSSMGSTQQGFNVSPFQIETSHREPPLIHSPFRQPPTAQQSFQSQRDVVSSMGSEQQRFNVSPFQIETSRWEPPLIHSPFRQPPTAQQTFLPQRDVVSSMGSEQQGFNVSPFQIETSHRETPLIQSPFRQQSFYIPPIQIETSLIQPSFEDDIEHDPALDPDLLTIRQSAKTYPPGSEAYKIISERSLKSTQNIMNMFKGKKKRQREVLTKRGYKRIGDTWTPQTPLPITLRPRLFPSPRPLPYRERDPRFDRMLEQQERKKQDWKGMHMRKVYQKSGYKVSGINKELAKAYLQGKRTQLQKGLTEAPKFEEFLEAVVPIFDDYDWQDIEEQDQEQDQEEQSSPYFPQRFEGYPFPHRRGRWPLEQPSPSRRPSLSRISSSLLTPISSTPLQSSDSFYEQQMEVSEQTEPLDLSQPPRRRSSDSGIGSERSERLPFTRHYQTDDDSDLED